MEWPTRCFPLRGESFIACGGGLAVRHDHAIDAHRLQRLREALSIRWSAIAAAWLGLFSLT